MWTQDSFLQALDFAARAHGAQAVPGSGFPYVVHLVKVATETLTACLAEPGCDIDLAVRCALLHDSIEDTETTAEQLEAAFGPKVTAGVQALTKNHTLPKEQQMADSLARLKAQPREVRMVKLGDRITNLEPPPPKWTLEKRRGYHAEAKLILDALRGTSAFLEARFERRLAAYEQYCR